MSPPKSSEPLQITGKTKVVFILGHPLEHSLSPLMHNAAFQKLRLSWLYTPLEISRDQIKPTLEVLKASNVKGANITVPYKEAVLPYLDWAEPEARWLGSVNTIFRKGDKLCGSSTDGEGFLRSLGSWRGKLKGSNGLLLGAGGAAKAVAGSLVRSGIKHCDIANRSPERASSLAKGLRQGAKKFTAQTISFKEAEKFLPRYDWIVQATSIGLQKDDPSPIGLETARPSTWVVDLIYHRNTAFLKEAKRRGIPCLNGIGMLLHQGALSFEYWTGKKAPLVSMRRVLLQALANR